MENKGHISDELLAAYLDGNTNEKETLEVLNALRNDSELREVVELSLRTESNPEFSYDPLPITRLAAGTGNNICSVLCEAYVLHRRNVPFKEKEMLDLAQRNSWLTPKGTPLHSIGKLLAHYGLMVTRKYDGTLEDIRSATALDNDILVAVDSDKLYPGRPDEEDAPNHAVIVLSIDDESKTVKIFDPDESAQTPIPITLFEQAWKESQNYMVRALQSIEDYEPQPINLENIPLSDNLSELQEAIAENAHEVWAAARIKEGWSYGPLYDDANKKDPAIIPYSSLPDNEKVYDRLMALDTIKLVKKLGFDIVKSEKRNKFSL